MRKYYNDQATEIAMDKARGGIVLKSKIAPLTFVRFPSESGRPSVKCYMRKASKPAFYYQFRSETHAETYCREYAEKIAASLALKAKEDAERKAARQSKTAADFHHVGDVFYTSWGYDQTNVEWFQIVRMTKRAVFVRQIRANCSDNGGPYGGETAPVRNEFCGPEIMCPISPTGHFSAGPCYGDSKKPAFRHSCYYWDGSKKHCSSYH